MLVKGRFFTVQQMLPLMEEGSSIILNTSFVTGFGIENFSVYSAAKSAVQSFIKTFSSECTAKKICVNGISPGYIKTNIFNNTGLTPDQIEGVVAGIFLHFRLKGLERQLKLQKLYCFLHQTMLLTFMKQKYGLTAVYQM